MKIWIGSILAAMTVMMLATTASATIINGALTGGSALSNGGTFVNLSPAAAISVGNDTFQDNNLYGFDEDQNILLAAPLAIDVGGSSIAAGTVVASHYLLFDPLGNTRAIGWFEFDSDVLGIITRTAKLAASDFLINNTVTYLNPGLRGLEIGQDVISIDTVNSRRVNLNFFASSPGDYVRVLTSRSPGAVPEPVTLALLGAGLAGFGFSRRKKNA